MANVIPSSLPEYLNPSSVAASRCKKAHAAFRLRKGYCGRRVTHTLARRGLVGVVRDVDGDVDESMRLSGIPLAQLEASALLHPTSRRLGSVQELDQEFLQRNHCSTLKLLPQEDGFSLVDFHRQGQRLQAGGRLIDGCRKLGFPGGIGAPRAVHFGAVLGVGIYPPDREPLGLQERRRAVEATSRDQADFDAESRHGRGA